VDNIDEYAETVTQQGGRISYRYGTGERPMITSTITVPYKTPSGMMSKTFTVYRTHHGPVVRKANDRWISVRLMQEPVKALTQSYTRTKARNYQEFRKTMELHTNSSNNTIFADAEGNIAYFHANFIPRRDVRFDFSKPVDGSNPAAEWGTLLAIDESPHLLNPGSGWLYNANNSPWSAGGPTSPKQSDYPAYVDRGSETSRARHAIRVLENRKDFTLERLRQAAFDSYLPSFEVLIPPLLRAWDETPTTDSLKARVQEQIDTLRAWDRRWGVTSIATTLAIAWADELEARTVTDARGGLSVDDYLATKTTPGQRLRALAVASDTLTRRFGSWKTPWGDVNRFQRLTGDIVQPFNDSGPSIPVGFTAGRWGSLASFAARSYRGSRKIYGTSGNSFVAVVEFGDSVRARAVTAGGLDSRPGSKHFNDQAQRYATGDLRDVYFYRPQLQGHSEREYHPGN
jgi:acyl-homoserine lactone acylase PvdQ